MDIRKHNRQAWDQKVGEGSPYTKPVSHETIEKSKAGEWKFPSQQKKMFQDIGFQVRSKG